MSLLVKYADVPVGARESTVLSAPAGQPFSYIDGVQDVFWDAPWITAEPAGWPLDGTRKLLPDAPAEMGWWSAKLSGADGSFAQPPTFVMTFPRRYTATGLTVTFWPSLGQWCSRVQILWYRGDALLEQLLAYPDTPEWILTHRVENFDRVELRLLETNLPFQYAKIGQLQIGRVFAFRGDELIEVNMLNEIDPSLCALSVDTMTVDIRNRRGYPLHPQRDQTIQLYRDGVQLAAHYITEAIRQSRSNYRIRCQSAIGRLEDRFLGGFYTECPLQTLLQAVLGEFPFRIDSAFSGATVTGYLPVCTRRQALQQIAFAIGAVVTTRGDGTVQLLPPSDADSGNFAADSIFAGAKLKQKAAVAAVELHTHRYLSGDEEKVILKETEIYGEELFLVFSEPYFSYHIQGGKIIDCDVNWIRLTGNGMVGLTGKKFRHIESVKTKKNPAATAAEKGNVVTVDNATLIHSGNADEALERLYRYHTMQSVLTQDVVVRGQMAGQCVESLNPWGGTVTGYITSMDSIFTDKGHRASIVIHGKEVGQ